MGTSQTGWSRKILRADQRFCTCTAGETFSRREERRYPAFPRRSGRVPLSFFCLTLAAKHEVYGLAGFFFFCRQAGCTKKRAEGPRWRSTSRIDNLDTALRARWGVIAIPQGVGGERRGVKPVLQSLCAPKITPPYPSAATRYLPDTNN